MIIFSVNGTTAISLFKSMHQRMIPQACHFLHSHIASSNTMPCLVFFLSFFFSHFWSPDFPQLIVLSKFFDNSYPSHHHFHHPNSNQGMNFFIFFIWFLHFDFSLFESCFSARYQRTEVGLIFLFPPVLYNWLHAAFPASRSLLASHPSSVRLAWHWSLVHDNQGLGGWGGALPSSVAGRFPPRLSSACLAIPLSSCSSSPPPWVWYHFSHPVESLLLSLCLWFLLQYCGCLRVCFLASLSLDSPVIFSVCLSVHIEAGFLFCFFRGVGRWGKREVIGSRRCGWVWVCI